MNSVFIQDKIIKNKLLHCVRFYFSMFIRSSKSIKRELSRGYHISKVNKC